MNTSISDACEHNYSHSAQSLRVSAKIFERKIFLPQFSSHHLAEYVQGRNEMQVYLVAGTFYRENTTVLSVL